MTFKNRSFLRIENIDFEEEISNDNEKKVQDGKRNVLTICKYIEYRKKYIF